MNAAERMAVPDLPESCIVGRRVPKKLLLENGAPTAADRRAINEGIEELAWIAALKPTTVGVPAYRDAVREYLEIAVLRLGLRAGAKGGRLAELVHRAVPYPVFLVAEHDGQTSVTLAHKRWSQGEAGKTVPDGDLIHVLFDHERPEPHEELIHREESYAIQGAMFEVYRELGSGFLEAVCQECLERELRQRGVPFLAQPELQLRYKGETLEQTYRPDLICYGKIIVELKAVRELAPEHAAQVLNYLKATGMKLGLLVNFCGHPRATVKRLVY